jgi:hypothetical protein
MNWPLFTAGIFGLAAAFGWGFAVYLHAKLSHARGTIACLLRQEAALREIVDAQREVRR